MKLSVISYRLDDLASQFGLPAPKHMKMDVDGIELEILQGGDILLQNPRVRDLMIEGEDGSDTMGQIEVFLGGKGFALEQKFKYALAGEEGKYARTHNFLFQLVSVNKTAMIRPSDCL